jgi:hypothetical protein
MTEAKNREHFAGANQIAKLVRTIVTLARRARLDYEGFRRVCAQVRKELGIRRPPRSRRLPRILSEADLPDVYCGIWGSLPGRVAAGGFENFNPSLSTELHFRLMMSRM